MFISFAETKKISPKPGWRRMKMALKLTLWNALDPELIK